MLITFEGGEGAGKTTLISFLEKKLNEKGYQVVKTREPGGDSFSEKLRSLVLESKDTIFDRTELFIFLAARAQHVKNVIEPALKNNQIVLCDRFTDSTIAYQGYARKMNLDFLVKACDFAAYSLVPDLTFYLDVPVEIGMQRRKTHGFDRMEHEQMEFHQKVRHGYLKQAQDHKKRIHVIDATKSQDEVFAFVFDILCDHLV